MRVTVCQMRDDRAGFASDWRGLREHVAAERADLVVLPELPFSTWFAIEQTYDASVWRRAMEEHAGHEAGLADLAPAAVISTRPVERAGRRYNEAFAALAGGAQQALHDKRYLPDEPGFFEASWYERGDGVFAIHRIAGANIGVQICSELWVLDESRRYGGQDVDLIVTPRATPLSSRDKWLIAGRAAAILAGAYSASSNHAGLSAGGFEFAGAGWIIDPDGDILAITSESEPFVTREIDLGKAAAAKTTYPRYLR